jgi:hypothetical protein
MSGERVWANVELPMGCRMRDLVRPWRTLEFMWGLLLIHEIRHVFGMREENVDMRGKKATDVK